MTYIPAEVLTTYVAVVAVLYPVTDDATAGTPTAAWVAFFVFLVLTPIVSWVIYAVKVANAKKPLPISIAKWPMWEMIAATIAYAIWAVALPNNPFSGLPWYSSGLAGIILLIRSHAARSGGALFTRNLLRG